MLIIFKFNKLGFKIVWEWIILIIRCEFNIDYDIEGIMFLRDKYFLNRWINFERFFRGYNLKFYLFDFNSGRKCWLG